MVGGGAQGRCRGLSVQGACGVAATCGLAFEWFAAMAPLTLSTWACLYGAGGNDACPFWARAIAEGTRGAGALGRGGRRWRGERSGWAGCYR